MKAKYKKIIKKKLKQPLPGLILYSNYKFKFNLSLVFELIINLKIHNYYH